MLIMSLLGIQRILSCRFGGARSPSDPQNEQEVISCSSEDTQEAVSLSDPVNGSPPSASCLQQSQPDAAVQHAPEEPLKAPNGASVQHVMFAVTSSPCSLHDEELISRTATSSITCASGSHSRRQSLLGDAGRASRRSSGYRDSLTDLSVPPVLQECQQLPGLQQLQQLQQQQSPGMSPTQQQDNAEPFWSTPWSYGQHSDQNQRLHMEDRISCQDLTAEAAFAGCKRAGFFAVYDGHAGHEAAEYLESHLLSYVLSSGPEDLRSRPLEALKTAVSRAEQEINSKFSAARCNAGSTLLALLLIDDKLHIANVGDSRAVLVKGTDAQQLTRDHKPACSLEQQRIEADDPAAEISCDGYMYGELAVARAIGSAHLKRDPSKRALIPTPDLISVQLSREDDFVVLATDGLWDKVDNAEMVRVARRTLAAGTRDASSASRALVERALRCSSSDNISVVTLLLHGRTISLPKSNSMLFKRQALSGLGGADSPRCSTPCSGSTTPACATPRPNTPCGPLQQPE